MVLFVTNIRLLSVENKMATKETSGKTINRKSILPRCHPFSRTTNSPGRQVSVQVTLSQTMACPQRETCPNETLLLHAECREQIV